MEVTKKDQAEHKKDIKFLKDELGKVLDDELKDFSNEDFKNPDQYFFQRVAALTTFIYLFEKLIELGEEVNGKKTVGIYSIYDEVMAGLFGLMSVNFFIRPLTDVIRDYLEIEPILVACAELTDVELDAIQDIPDTYNEKLSERLAQIIEPGKKISKPKSRPHKKKSTPAKKAAKKKSSKSRASKKASKKKPRKKTSGKKTSRKKTKKKPKKK